MNQGIFGFSRNDSNLLSVQEFDASGTYIIPPGTRRLKFLAVGGGGGGGGGSQQVSATNAFGGGGGAGGTILIDTLDITTLNISPGDSLIITIGVGGAGGNGASAISTSGTNGIAGGNTLISLSGKQSSQYLIVAAGGNLGSGGTTTAGTAGAAGNGSINGVVVSHGAGTAGNASSSATSVQLLSILTNGGAGAGGKNTLGTGFAGGGILIGSNNPATTTVGHPNYARSATVKSGGVANSATSVAFRTIQVLGPYTWGMGGAGGGGGGSTSANNGEAGWRGSGGGGGGGALNSLTTGNGGKGGDGYVVIWAMS